MALSCTEIPLLVTPEDSPLPTLDSTRLLAHAAVEVAVGARRCRRGGADRLASKRALFVALALCGMPVPRPARTTDTLTVVTLNLWHDQHDWPKRLQVILAEMRRIRPDVLCLQEVLQNANLPNQAETLGDSLGCHVQFASVDRPERPKRYGNAILTPHRVLSGGSRNLDPADDYRAVAHVRFEWRGA